MATTYETYPCDGTVQVFVVPFPYLEREHVKIYLDNVEDTEFTWESDTTVRLSATPVNGSTLVIKRETPTDNLLVDFEDSSLLDQETLDTAHRVLFYMMQESVELLESSMQYDHVTDLWDASGKRITNVADPQDPQDAITLGFMDSSYVPTMVGMVEDVEKALSDVNDVEGRVDLAEGRINTLEESANQSVIDAASIVGVGERTGSVATDFHVATEGQTEFSISEPANYLNILVFMNSRKLRWNEDYTLDFDTAASVLTLATAALADDELEIVILNTYDVEGVVSDASGFADAASASATVAITQVGLAEAEVDKAKAEVTKVENVVIDAKAEVVKAADEVAKAKAEVTNAKAEVDKAEAETVKSRGYSLSAEQYAIIAQSAAFQDMSAIDKIISGSSNIVDVCIYDTSKDIDEGAWRKKTQRTSWYREALNTAIRGATRMFPAVALIVAEASKVTIYDATDPLCPMWMVFEGASGSNTAFLRAGISSVAFLNGVMVTGHNLPSINNMLLRVDFLSELARRDYTTVAVEATGIVNRNSCIFGSSTGPYIVNRYVNDVAMTMLPDRTTPTIAVATDGGVSVIDGPAGVGTVVDSADSIAFYHLHFGENNDLFVGTSSSVSTAFYRVCRDYSTDSFPSTTLYQRFTTYVAGRLNLLTEGSDNKPIATQGAVGTEGGLTLLKENPITPAEGMVNYITSDYQSGWQVGDSLMATLADTKAGTVTDGAVVPDRSPKDNPLQVVGELTKTPVATGSELVAYSGFSADNYIEQPYNADLDFGTGDFCIMGWFLNDGTANQEQSIYARGLSGSSVHPHVRVYYNPSTGDLNFKVRNTLNDQLTVNSPATSAFKHFACIRNSSGLFTYIDDVLMGTTAGTGQDATIAGAVVNIGVNNAQLATTVFDGSITLLRVSATVPSANQIKDIYETEKHLFTPDAKCTLQGDSSSVLSLAYDEDYDQLVVATDDAVTVLQEGYVLESRDSGCSSVAVNDGAILTGSDEAARYTEPSRNLRAIT